ncbi:MAG: hypothetical protein E6K24_17610 [Gammaproteobacteria bacterium]|nr:MAG: hypothetical protein E6K24_17610 [Gammaproteobacteria bacterium]
MELFGLKPHRTESFKLSTDAFFIEKLRDVVGTGTAALAALSSEQVREGRVRCADAGMQRLATTLGTCDSNRPIESANSPITTVVPP